MVGSWRYQSPASPSASLPVIMHPRLDSESSSRSRRPSTPNVLTHPRPSQNDPYHGTEIYDGSSSSSSRRIAPSVSFVLPSIAAPEQTMMTANASSSAYIGNSKEETAANQVQFVRTLVPNHFNLSSHLNLTSGRDVGVVLPITLPPPSVLATDPGPTRPKKHKPRRLQHHENQPKREQTDQQRDHIQGLENVATPRISPSSRTNVNPSASSPFSHPANPIPPDIEIVQLSTSASCSSEVVAPQTVDTTPDLVNDASTARYAPCDAEVDKINERLSILSKCTYMKRNTTKHLSTLRRAVSDTCIQALVYAPSPELQSPPLFPRSNYKDIIYNNSMLKLVPPRSIFSSADSKNDNSYSLQKSIQFGQFTVDAVNDAAICILISLGHRLGLFTLLAKQLAPKGSAEIADEACLNRRCVDEWLCAMTCCGVVESFDDGSRDVTYRLPAEHSLWLTWCGSLSPSGELRQAQPGTPGQGESAQTTAASSNNGNNSSTHHASSSTILNGTNLALMCEGVSVLARLENAIVHAYRRGTAVKKGLYGEYDKVQAYDVMQTVGVRLLSVLRVNDALIDELATGSSVLCIGGAADVVYVRLARLFPKSWFTIYNVDERHVQAVRQSTEELNLTNIHFKAIPRLTDIYERVSYDVGLIFDTSLIRQHTGRDVVHCLTCIRRALRPARPVLLVEIVTAGNLLADRGHELATFLFTRSAFVTVPRAIAALPRTQRGKKASWSGSRDDTDISGSGLFGHNQIRDSLAQAEFTNVQTFPLEDDSLNCIVVASTPAASRGADYD